MNSKEKSTTKAGSGAALVPKLRFPEFQDASAWETAPGDELFQQVSNRETPPGLPILAITQEYGAIPRHMIDYHVSVTDKSLETYKEVRPADFIISLRSFQGGIEFSNYHGICSPAYVILRKRGRLSDTFYRQHFKSYDFIKQLTRNLEGLRDGKMISYKQFSVLQLLKPTLPEQQKIADCLDSVDALIVAHERKVEALRARKKGLMQQLFPQEGETQPHLRFPEFLDSGDWGIKLSGELFTNRKEKGEAGLPIYSVTINDGMVPRSTFDRNFYDIEDPSGNRKAHRGDIAYNMMRMWQGALGTAPEDCMVSPAYVVLKPRRGTCPEFFAYFFKLPQSLKLLTITSRGLTKDRLRLYFDDFANMPMCVPDKPEQQRIADCLTSLDDLIVAETRKLNTFKTHKKGLMQQLFPQVGQGNA